MNGPYESLDESHMENHLLIDHLLGVIPLKKIMILYLYYTSIIEYVFHLIRRQQYFLSWPKRRAKGIYVVRGSWLITWKNVNIIYLIHLHESMQRLRGSKSIKQRHNDKGNWKEQHNKKEHYDRGRNIYIMEYYLWWRKFDGAICQEATW